MRTAVFLALMLCGACAAEAHSYRIGNLEIVHPAIMVPEANSDCTCAHVTITNHGSEPEYFLGADVSIARETRLLHVADHSHGISAPATVEIAPGATLDLQPYTPLKPWRRYARYVTVANSQGGSVRKRWLVEKLIVEANDAAL